MRYETASSLRSSLEDRLPEIASDAGISTSMARKLIAFHRLLARLIRVAPDRWVLKGGTALLYRAGTGYRSTKDLDLGRSDNEEAATEDFLAVQATDLKDHFNFVVEKSPGLDALGEKAVRYHVIAELAGRTFEEFVVDVGFEPLLTPPDTIAPINFLRFADIDPIQVPVIPLARHLSEKVHAYTRTYNRGRSTSRTKDLVDIVYMAMTFEFQAGTLWDTLRETFLAADDAPDPRQAS